jgi:Phage tail sheath protein subtilisin-like domain
MAINHSSAGVYVNENDQSQTIRAVSTSIGAIVGVSSKGPVNQATLITSQANFLNVFGKPNSKYSFMHYCALAFLEESSQLYVTRVCAGNPKDSSAANLTSPRYGGLICQQVGAFNISTPFAKGYVNPLTDYAFSNADLFIVYGINQGAWNNSISVIIRPAIPDNFNSNTFIVEVYYGTSTVPVEKFLCSLNNQIDGFGVQQNIEHVINRRSNYISIVQNQQASALVRLPASLIINSVDGEHLRGGFDGAAISGDPKDASFFVTAWRDNYMDPEAVQINILINAGYYDPAVQMMMQQICETRMDCVAILDVPPAMQKTADALNFRRNDMHIDSSYCALYSPDLYIADSYNGQTVYIPPSGHVAAIYARTDYVASAWNAPAGMNRGGLNILGLAQIYNQVDRDMLDASQINAIRVIYGAGIKVWGSSTLQVMQSALSEMSVRRLMIMLEQSIAFAALFSVFEQNDNVLRAKLSSLATGFLTPIKNGNGIYNFQVVCDTSNNTPDIIASGDTILDVYIDPALPVKRIHLNAVIAPTGGISFAINQNS